MSTLKLSYRFTPKTSADMTYTLRCFEFPKEVNKLVSYDTVFEYEQIYQEKED